MRRLVEQDQVAFLFNPLGTPTNTAIRKYCNQKKVPQLFVATGPTNGATTRNSLDHRLAAQLSDRGADLRQYILQEKPDAKIGLLYQNDDFGKDYLAGLKDVLGDVRQGGHGRYL